MQVYFRNISAFVFLLCALASCSVAVRYSSNVGNAGTNNTATKGGKQETKLGADAGKIFRGKASFYADKFDGRKTANGETFDQSELTAAHRELPFNTKLLVTNLKNGKQVTVRVNDRGPFVDDRIIDLSKAAATALAMIADGVAEVEIEVLGDYGN